MKGLFMNTRTLVKFQMAISAMALLFGAQSALAAAFLHWTDGDFTSAAMGMAIAYAQGGEDKGGWSSAVPHSDSQGNTIVIVSLTVPNENLKCRYDVTFSQIGTGIAEGKATVEDKGCK
jgi:hypothetical protein